MLQKKDELRCEYSEQYGTVIHRCPPGARNCACGIETGEPRVAYTERVIKANRRLSNRIKMQNEAGVFTASSRICRFVGISTHRFSEGLANGLPATKMAIGSSGKRHRYVATVDDLLAWLQETEWPPVQYDYLIKNKASICAVAGIPLSKFHEAHKRGNLPAEWDKDSGWTATRGNLLDWRTGYGM